VLYTVEIDMSMDNWMEERFAWKLRIQKGNHKMPRNISQ